MSHTRTNQKGFTIIELMIATSVFSLVLMLCSYAFLEIGRNYYKGVTSTRTQETSREIMNEITDSIKFGGASVNSLSSKGAIEGFCIGGRKFSYILNKQLSKNPTLPDQSKHVIMVDGSGCTSGSEPDADFVSGRELMSERMRLARLEVSEISPDLYRVTVRVVSGEEDLLEKDAGNFYRCKNVRAGSQFCSTSELTTVVERRV